jgi:hypothetical protein
MERLKFGFALFVFLISSTANATFFDDELPSPISVHPLLSEKKPFVVELGFNYSHPDLPDVSNVVVENEQTSNTTTGSRTGNVASDYPDTFAQTLKVQALLDAAQRWTVALKTYLPLNSLSQMDSGYIYQPEFVLYRAEKQRPRILLTSAADVNPDLRFGLGLDIGFSVEAQANIYLQSGTTSSGAPTYSDQRITAKVKPTFIPQAAIEFHHIAFTVRGENKVKFDLSANASARVFSTSSAGVDFSYLSSSAAYYQPWELEISGKQEFTDSFDVKWSASYQLWSGYQARAATITPAPNTCPVGQADCAGTFSPSAAPDSQGRNILVPEVVFEFFVPRTVAADDPTQKPIELPKTRLQLGYRYKASIFKGLPTGNGNYLDPPRHDLLLSALFNLKNGWQWSINTQVSRLTSQTVVKSDPNAIGGPGYTVAGWTYGGGVNLTVPFKE